MWKVVSMSYQFWYVMKTPERWCALPRRTLFTPHVCDVSGVIVLSNGSVVRALTDRHTHTRTGPIPYPRPLTREGIIQRGKFIELKVSETLHYICPWSLWGHNILTYLFSILCYQCQTPSTIHQLSNQSIYLKRDYPGSIICLSISTSLHFRDNWLNICFLV